MTVVLFPSSSNVYQTMLRQLLWVGILCVWKVDATDYVFQRECHTVPCGDIDLKLRIHVNLQLDPCDNFLAHACQNNITGGSIGYNNDRNDFNNQGINFFGQKKHNLADDFYELLTGPFVEKQDGTNSALKWEQEVYARCHKNINNQENDFNYYMSQLGDAKRLNGDDKTDYYFIHGNENRQIESWTVTDRKYAKKGIGFAFFDFNIVAINLDDPYAKEKRRYIQISPMTDDPMTILEFFHAYYNVSYDTPITKYTRLKKFLNNLPRSKDNDVEEERDGKQYKISDWQQEWDTYATGTQLNWLHHLNHLGFENLRSNEIILVKNRKYFESLAKKLHDTQTLTITDFVHLRYVMKTIGFVLPAYRKYAIIPHIDGLACSPGLMIGVASAYKTKYFPLGDRRMMEEMFKELKSNIKQKLGDINDGHEPTVAATKTFLRKLDESNVVIGYPDWLNSTKATTLYSVKKSGGIHNTFFLNQMYALEALLKHQVLSYVSRDTLVYEMDTYYKSLIQEDFKFDLERNEITIPLSLFNEHTYKYFSTLLYYPINYASAGTAIAQKLYYTYLNEISYTSPPSRVPKCVEDNAHGLYFEKKKNYIMDSTSWLLAVRDSFKSWPNHDGLPIRFKEFGAISEKQLFYLIFAQSMCQLPNFGKEGPASHINFAVTNSKGFQEAFHCTEKQNHYKRVSELCEPLQY